MFNPSRPTNSVHKFSEVPKVKHPRSQFNRSHCYKTTFNSGYLIPFFVDEALPGDTFNLTVNCFARMATPIVPLMDNLYLDTFFFFVPNRLLWEHWEEFNGAQVNPGDPTDYLIPQVQAPGSGGVVNGTLYDYMGIPTAINSILFNNLHGRAYNLIWNEWFRDQNLQNSVTVDTGDGPDTYTNYVLLKRGRRHDYFTSCLPWPQKGPAVELPLGTTAPVGNIGVNTLNSSVFTTYQTADFNTAGVFPLGGSMALNPTQQPAWLVNYENASTHKQAPFANSPGLGSNSGSVLDNTGDGTELVLGVPFGGLTADLSSATAATINQLRQAFQIQRMYERDARGGTRYTEILRSHFGVISPDARLQRPEYLGGQSTPIRINPIAQTSGTGASGTTTPQGNLAAIGTVATKGHGFTQSFVEHGVILGLMEVRADLTYQQGLNRMWSRQTRFDFYWPSLAFLGEQAVLNQEIYCQGTTADAAVFGYQERYAEYRYYPSLVTGEFRSNYSQPLDFWHLALDFGSLPSLNSTFIQDTPPIARVVADDSDPQFLFDSFFQIRCARPMPLYGVPGLIDHF